MTFIQDLRRKFADIQRDPLICQLRSDIGEDARMATVGNYAILFPLVGDVIRIERAVYGGRSLPEVFDPS
jgi:toxin ParE1/3/4